MKKITMLRYRWRKKDYFTQVTDMVTNNQFHDGFTLASLTMLGNTSLPLILFNNLVLVLGLNANGPFIAGSESCSKS